MRLIDEQFLNTPFYGSRRTTASLQRSGELVGKGQREPNFFLPVANVCADLENLRGDR
jgi:hypothetical protein